MKSNRFARILGLLVLASLLLALVPLVWVL